MRLQGLSEQAGGLRAGRAIGPRGQLGKAFIIDTTIIMFLPSCVYLMAIVDPGNLYWLVCGMCLRRKMVE